MPTPMTGLLLARVAAAASAGAQVDAPGHATLAQWVGVGAMLGVVLGGGIALIVAGDPGAAGRRRAPLTRLVSRPLDALERLTGLPGWCAAGVLLGIWSLVSAGIGFFWDVAWHIDLGRDNELFTPPHTLILAGLFGILVSGVASIIAASVGGAPTRWRLGRVRLPLGAAALTVLGVGATIGFPLDDLWHKTYGVDVTMWGPTHLLMIGGAAFSPLAVWLLLAEAGPDAGRPRLRRMLVSSLATITLVGLSAFQLEFDDGVPQWQNLYQPVLIALAATLTLTAARVVIGRGWALLTAVSFLGFRLLMALLVGGLLGHTTPYTPLYLGIAACVEIAYAVSARRPAVIRALSAGVLAGTVGLATEWAMSHIVGRQPWQPSLLAGIWAAALIAVAAAVLGAALGSALSRGASDTRIRGRWVAAAGVAALGLLVVPLPRHQAAISATVTTTTRGASMPTIDRYGRASFTQQVAVELRTTPADAVRGADTFRVISWQGGGRVAAALVEVSPGVWRADGTVPTGGSWKTMIYLAKRDLLVAAPVSFPRDLEAQNPAIPVAPTRTEGFVAASSLLMRESHGGATWPAVVAYTALSLVTIIWLVVLVAGLAQLGGGGAGGSGQRSEPQAPSPRPQHRWRRDAPAGAQL